MTSPMPKPTDFETELEVLLQAYDAYELDGRVDLAERITALYSRDLEAAVKDSEGWAYKEALRWVLQEPIGAFTRKRLEDRLAALEQTDINKTGDSVDISNQDVNDTVIPVP